MVKAPKRTGRFLLDISHRTIYYSQRDGVYRIAENGDGGKLLSGSNAVMKLSDSGRYLAITTDINRILVYDLTDTENTVPVWQYKYSKSTVFKDFCFAGDEILYISDHCNMICLDLNSHGVLKKCVCHSYLHNGNTEYSYIHSFACDGRYLYLLCRNYISRPSYFSVVDTRTYEEVQYAELPAEFGTDYSFVLVNPSGYLCVFSLLGRNPARAYRLKDHLITNEVLFEKKLPATLSAVFSSDYRYITVWENEDNYPGHNAWLLKGDDFEVIHRTDNGKTFAPDFADGSRYWLLPGQNSMVMELGNHEHSAELDHVWELIR